MVLEGLLWSSIVFYDLIQSHKVYIRVLYGLFLVLYGLLQSCMILYRLIWSCIVLYGLTWSCIVLYGLPQSCMILYSLIWSTSFLYGLLCLCMVFYCFVRFPIVLYDRLVSYYSKTLIQTYVPVFSQTGIIGPVSLKDLIFLFQLRKQLKELKFHRHIHSQLAHNSKFMRSIE